MDPVQSSGRLTRLVVLAALIGGLGPATRGDEAPRPITHAFLATGAETYLREGDGTIAWRYPAASRDGWVLPNGNILLALAKSASYPGGGVVEVRREGGPPVFEYRGTQSEVNTAQRLDDGNTLIAEAGDRPRLIEVDPSGRVAVDVPLKAQTTNHHLQARMARKLANGNYLVPQLLDKVVREYTPAGAIAWEAATPDMPFTAIRLPGGNTLVGCTLGHSVVEIDPRGAIAWRVSNDDLPGRPIRDACGVQRLPNGNTVIASYAAKGAEVRLIEVTPARAVVWTYRDEKRPGVHHFQILDTDGRPIGGPALR